AEAHWKVLWPEHRVEKASLVVIHELRLIQPPPGSVESRQIMQGARDMDGVRSQGRLKENERVSIQWLRRRVRSLSDVLLRLCTEVHGLFQRLRPPIGY